MRHAILCTGLAIGFAMSAVQDAAAQSRSMLELGASTERSIIVEQLQSGTVAPPGAVIPTVAPGVAVAPPAHVPGTPQEATILMPIQFGFDSDALRPEARAILNRLAEIMTDPQFRTARFLLEGHTDVTGSWDYNLNLSQRRANSVAQYLILQGVPRERVMVVGYSWNRLLPGLAPHHPNHRRVEIGRLAQ